MSDVLSSRKTLLSFWIPIVFLLGCASGYLFNSKFCSVTVSDRVNSGMNVYFTFRKLWAEHVIWTHRYLESDLNDNPKTSLVAQRLIRNQEDLGAAIGTYYGKATGDLVATLVKEHMFIAMDMLTARRLKNEPHIEELEIKQYKNADDIATALSELNPTWHFDTIKKLMYEHLDFTGKEVMAILQNDMQTTIQLFDQEFDAILELGVQMAQGIIKQFPAKI